MRGVLDLGRDGRYGFFRRRNLHQRHRQSRHVHIPNTSLPDDLPNIDNSQLVPWKSVEASQDRTANNWVAAARSNHAANFVTVGFADGSTHKFNDSIDPTIWAGMATRAGNEKSSRFLNSRARRLTREQ